MRNLTPKYWFLLLCLTALFSRAAAQPAGYTHNPITGTITWLSQTTYSGHVIDSLTREPLPGAVISVVEPEVNSKNETAVRNYTTDKKGQFRFTCSPSSDIRMEISFLGYKIRTVWLGTDQPQVDLGNIRMAESAQKIDDVVVKARMQMYKMKGDTTVYFPKAVKTMEGDKALEILRSMPGVKVSDDGSVKIHGKSVERTYVNSRLLFGEDPKTALKQLDASEVASIQSYDEVDEDDVLKHGENAKKRKVLNVVTFEKFSRSIAANARGEAGTDFEQDAEGHRPARYAASVDAGYYCEALQAVVKGEANNVEKNMFGSLQPGSNSIASTEASVSGNIGEVHRYRASYRYNNYKKENWDVGDYTYFPSEYFASKRSADTTRSEQRLNSHLFSANYFYRKNDWMISADLSGNIVGTRSTTQQTNRTEQDQALLLATTRNTNSDQHRNSFNGSFSASRGFSNKGSLSFGASFSQSDLRQTDFRRESQTTAEGTRLSDLRITSAQPDHTFSGNASYILPSSRFGVLSFNLSAKASKSKDRKLYVDPQTGTLQVALSDDATDHLTEWKMGPSYYFSKKSHSLRLDLYYTLAPRNYRNRIFDTSDKRLYQMLDGSASYTYQLKKGSLSFNLSNSHTLPTGTDFSSRIDDNSPLFLTSGNPSLRPSKNYETSVSASFMGDEGTFDFSLRATLTTDPVIQKRTYFETNTVLPQYDDYVALAGSTLSVPVNGSNIYGIAPTLGYSTRIVPIKCFIDIRADYSYLNSEEDTYTGFGRAQNHTGSFGLSLTSNFSSLFRITLMNKAEGRWYRTAAGYSDRILRENLSATFRWDLLKRCFLSGMYTFEVNRYKSSAANSDNNILCLSVGCRMLDRKATLSFNAYDILNQTTNLRVSQDAQGISYTWQRIYGSYFTFAFEYKFNNRK